MMGFRATDDDEDTPQQVVDGVASEREPSPAERIELFVGLCERLRDMGACEVRANDYRAVWPAQATPQPAPVVHRIPVGPKKADDAPLEAFEGEQLTPDDRARRGGYRDVRRLIRGEQ